MKDTLYKVVFCLAVYVSAMIVVSLSSDVISLISDGAETAHVETKSDEITTVDETETQDETQYESQNESPFDFSVNVITETEAEEETAVYEKIFPIYRIEQTSPTTWVLEELEKRKSNEGVRVSGYGIYGGCVLYRVCCPRCRYFLGGVPTTAKKRHRGRRKGSRLYRIRYRLY
jgi:hypothetical protein